MQCPKLNDLPSPPPGKTGWPWTEESNTLPDEVLNPPCRISIISPSYNSAPYIEETIRSILLQGYPDLEYIIIDGGSTDGSLEIIKRYEEWISFWVSEPDRGYADAVNKGFARATGQIRAWLPLSDLYAPGALEAAHGHLGDGRTDFLFGRPRQISDDGEVIGLRPVVSKNLRHLTLYARRNPCQPATFWRCELHQQAGELNANLRYAADSEWFLRLALIGRCRWGPEVLCDIRRHPGQISSVYLEEMRKEWFLAWDAVVRHHRISRLKIFVGAILVTPMMRYRVGGLRSLLRRPRFQSLRGFVATGR